VAMPWLAKLRRYSRIFLGSSCQLLPPGLGGLLACVFD